MQKNNRSTKGTLYFRHSHTKCSVSATQKSDEVRPGKKKKKLPDEVRPDEVHPGSGKNGWGEGPGYIVKWTSGVRPRRGRTPPRIEK